MGVLLLIFFFVFLLLIITLLRLIRLVLLIRLWWVEQRQGLDQLLQCRVLVRADCTKRLVRLGGFGLCLCVAFLGIAVDVVWNV